MNRYVVVNSLSPTNPVELAMDSLGSYDSEFYRAEIAAGKINELVEEEWTHVWTQADNSFDNEAKAVDYSVGSDVGPGLHHIVEVSREHVRQALLRAFGDRA